MKNAAASNAKKESSLPVADTLNLFIQLLFGNSETSKERLADFEVRDFAMGCDVVGLSNTAFVKDGIDRVCYVRSIKIAASVGSIAVQRKQFVLREQ